jgi:predicted nucleotidyltransferase
LRDGFLISLESRTWAVSKRIETIIVNTILSHYPAVQGVYLFGSYATGENWPESDIDIAVLLPHEQAKLKKNLILSECRFELEKALNRDVDLLNARQASTVFQKEIISGLLIYSADQYAVDEFEMLVLSYYQKLNEERQHILESFGRTGRAYEV